MATAALNYPDNLFSYSHISLFMSECATQPCIEVRVNYEEHLKAIAEYHFTGKPCCNRPDETIQFSTFQIIGYELKVERIA